MTLYGELVMMIPAFDILYHLIILTLNVMKLRVVTVEYFCNFDMADIVH